MSDLPDKADILRVAEDIVLGDVTHEDLLKAKDYLLTLGDEAYRLRSEIERLRGQEGGALAPELNPNAVSEAYRLWVQDTHEGDDQPRWVRISDVGLVDMVYAAFKAGALAPGLGASPSGLDPADVRDEIAEFLFDAFDPEGAVESPHGPYIWDDMSDAYQSKYTACADEILQLAEPVRSTAPTPPVQTPKTQVTDRLKALYLWSIWATGGWDTPQTTSATCYRSPRPRKTPR